MRLLRSLFRIWIIGTAMEVFSVFTVVLQAENILEKDSLETCLSTSELMARIQESLPESIQALNQLKIQGPPKLGERRSFRHPRYSLTPDLKALARLEGVLRFTPYFRHIETKCVKILKGKAYIFIEVGYGDNFETETEATTKAFSEIQKKLTKLFGRQEFDVDQDPAVYFIISPSAFPKASRDIVSRVSYTDIEISFPNSNGAEIIYIRPYAFGGIDIRTYLGHEYSHILTLSYDWDDEVWIQEGLGYISAFLTGYPPEPDHRAPLDKFLRWGIYRPGEKVVDDHISVYQFFRFLYDKYGLESLRKILQDTCDGKESIADSVDKSWDEVWSDYTVFIKNGAVFTRRPP